MVNGFLNAFPPRSHPKPPFKVQPPVPKPSRSSPAPSTGTCSSSACWDWIIGAFLIYNTMTFSIVRRRPIIGSLRALGVTRRQVFAVVLGEALAIGVVSSIIGVLLGILIGARACPSHHAEHQRPVLRRIRAGTRHPRLVSGKGRASGHSGNPRGSIRARLGGNGHPAKRSASPAHTLRRA